MKENRKLPWMIDRFFCLLKDNKRKGLLGPLIILKKYLIYIRERRKVILFKKFLKTKPVNREVLFTQIYRNDMWGKSEDPNLKYYSGYGSDPERTQEYIDLVNSFISRHNIRSIVDCGCGDFRVASNFLIEKYVGVDICKELIAFNNERFSTDAIKFLYLDIVKDEIPSADICLIRQVLQHFSNSEIQKLLSKLSKFKYVLITDEITEKKISENEDKETDLFIREQGLFLELPPFNRKIKILNTSITDIGIIRTILLA
ncbi:MAG: class I SAM-dependent methyltransferase [Candidatus Hodarchaeales archaeon]|jgi:hypothetical protein